MPILALCEKGLIIDVFGQNQRIFKSDEYKMNNNKLISVYKHKIRFLNLLNSEEDVELDISGFSELKQSEDGTKVAVLCSNKELKVFEDAKLINSIENVENYDISNKYYSVSTKTHLQILDFEHEKAIYEAIIQIKNIHCLENEVIAVSEKAKNSQAVFLFKENKMYKILEHPQIFRTVIKQKSNEILLLADTEYTSKSYYAESTLYLIKFSDLDKLIELESPDKELINIENKIGIVNFTTLKKIHSFGFHKDKIYVCFGDQPAYVHLYNLMGVYENKLPRAVRNEIIFNKSGNRVINAGFGNLPGIVEIFEDGKSVCYFESLGAATAEWLPDNTHFMISTTNYFKSDNKVCVYDYYGRLIKTMEFNSLVSARVYGEEEPEQQIDKPEKLMQKVVVEAYVPPHLKAGIQIIPKIIKKPQSGKNKQKTTNSAVKTDRTVEIVKKELEECKAMKERMIAGEELCLEDENKIFKIKNLEAELDKLLTK